MNRNLQEIVYYKDVPYGTEFASTKSGLVYIRLPSGNVFSEDSKQTITIEKEVFNETDLVYINDLIDDINCRR